MKNTKRILTLLFSFFLFGIFATPVSAQAEDNYGNVWLNKSNTGSFVVHNTHTGEIGVTWKVESSSNNSWAQIYMESPNGITVLKTVRVRPSDGDVRFRIRNAYVGDYKIRYIASTSVGMRIMCWTYK